MISVLFGLLTISIFNKAYKLVFAQTFKGKSFYLWSPCVDNIDHFNRVLHCVHNKLTNPKQYLAVVVS